MDVQEVKKLDAYLKRQFGNARIRLVPKSADSAESDAMPRISDVVNTVEPQDVCGERA